MVKSKLGNPFAFTPLPVTLACSLVYLAVAAVLLVINGDVPPSPAAPSFSHVNITEAWHDLQFLSNGFHPYNSRRNDVVHDWILTRVDEILRENGADSKQESSDAVRYSSATTDAVVFEDMTSNLTFTGGSVLRGGISTYYEGNNIIVYVRGSADEKGSWWTNHRSDGGRGVLVNAHYDSVPTGNGATDDGVGVISLLHLIKHFSAEGNQPKHGIVFLFNNGEENYLNGARVFGLHPTSRFPVAFLNLEGAGAGGRAILFRTTDTEVTRKYKGTQHPFGTVILGDGFKQGLVRSQTDYVVFNGDLGMRGLDVAFFEPRARYHTAQDDARHTSPDSIWHMLSASLHTVHGLTDEEFTKGQGSNSVWFDMFGKGFAVFELHTLFAISVTLLVVSPLVLIAAFAFLSKADKLYPFSNAQTVDGQRVRLKGLRGFFRFPFLVGIPTAISVGLALLVVKVNPFVVHSSPYAVWSMMLSAWVFVCWFVSRAADFARPSVLHRLYTCLWLFVVFWALLVGATVLEDNKGIASGYFVVWYFLGVALATAVGVFELFALDKKADFAFKQLEEPQDSTQEQASTNKPRRTTISRPQSSTAPADDNGPTETTSLLSGQQRSTFANYSVGSADDTSVLEEEEEEAKPYGCEQAWGLNIPSWTWLLQLLFLVPANLIFVGQIALVLTDASYQTLADGSDPHTVYLLISGLSTLLLVPLVPFLHRFTFHVPTLCLAIFGGTLIYNLVAFPFSANQPLKFYFVQRVDLDSGVNRVGINGVGKPFIPDIVGSIPSAAGQQIEEKEGVRADLFELSYNGMPPLVVPASDPDLPPGAEYGDWVTFNATRVGPNKATFTVRGRNTRSCKIEFDRRVQDVEVEGSGYDERFPTRVDGGSSEIRLWSREWEKTWTVTATWPADDDSQSGAVGMDGRVVCMWNEEQPGLIPALQEVRRFAPPWAIVTSLGDGLVEGFKRFVV